MFTENIVLLYFPVCIRYNTFEEFQEMRRHPFNARIRKQRRVIFYPHLDNVFRLRKIPCQVKLADCCGILKRANSDSRKLKLRLLLIL